MIRVHELAKRFGAQEILDGLSFVANPGQVTLLLGSNGVGKTTTLRILAGLLAPDGGDALIAGQSIVKDRAAAQQMISFLPQGVAFHPRLSCETVLRFYAEVRGIEQSDIAPLLGRVGLTEHRKKQTGQLSGGLRQRLGLGVLLLANAPVLLLDEPGLSLDPEWRGRLREILQVEAAHGKTVLVATHLLGEWEGAAQRALLCEAGGQVREIDPLRLREGVGLGTPRKGTNETNGTAHRQHGLCLTY